MGNEDEIKQLVHVSKEHFLPEDVADTSARPELYSLEAEFRKSPRNKEYLFYIVLGGFLLALIGSAALLTQYIQHQYKNREVRITEFQDMNLKALLDAARSDEKRLSLAIRSRNNLESERTKAIADARGKAAQQREAYLTSKRSPQEKKRLVAASRKQELDAVAGIRKDYGQRIAEKDQEIARLRAAVAKRNREVAGGLKKTRDLVSNYERLTQMKMDRQRRYYENRVAETILRYNPYFRESRVRRIVRGARGRPTRPAPLSYTGELAREGRLNRSAYGALLRKRSNYFHTLDRMRRIPYRNSVAPALAALDRDSTGLVGSYERLNRNLSAAIRNRNAEIASYRYSLEYYVRLVPEAGYVVDARNSARVRTYLKRVVRVKGGQTARVFRRDTQFIALIEFLPGSGGRLAKVIQLQPGRRIRPFDRILINAR